MNEFQLENTGRKHFWAPGQVISVCYTLETSSGAIIINSVKKTLQKIQWLIFFT